MSASSSHDFQNFSEGTSYTAGGGGNSNSPSLSGKTVSADDRPISNLRRTTGDTTQSSRAVAVVDSSPEQARTALAPASVNPSILERVPSFFTGVLERGLPSSLVQESFCSLSEADLGRICKTHRIDRDRF